MDLRQLRELLHQLEHWPNDAEVLIEVPHDGLPAGLLVPAGMTIRTQAYGRRTKAGRLVPEGSADHTIIFFVALAPGLPPVRDETEVVISQEP